MDIQPIITKMTIVVIIIITTIIMDVMIIGVTPAVLN